MGRKVVAVVFAAAMAAVRSGETRESVDARYTLSRETTYIVEPLLPDGAPDYGAYLDARFAAGATAENNAAAVLQPLFESEPGEGPRFRGGFIWERYDALVRFRARDGELPTRCERKEQFDAFQSQWSRFGDGACRSDTCPLAIEVVEANDAALARMVEASWRSRYWVPYPDGVSIRYAERKDVIPRFAQATLRARGWLALERGDWAASARDALALQRLGTVVIQGRAFSEIIGGLSLRSMASEVLVGLASSEAFSPAEARELAGELDQIEALPTDLTADRLGTLTTLIEMSGTTSAEWRNVLEPEGFESNLISDALYEVPETYVDWDEALRSVNRLWDRMEALLQSATPAEHDARLAQYQEELRQIESARRLLESGRLASYLYRTEDEETRRRDLTRAVVAGAQLSPEWIKNWWLSAEARSVFARTALDLAISRSENGAWPERLLDETRRAAGTLGYRFDYARRPTDGTIRLLATPATGDNATMCWDSRAGLVEGWSTTPFVDDSCEFQEVPTASSVASWWRKGVRGGYCVFVAAWILSIGALSRRRCLDRAVFVASTVALVEGVLRALRHPETSWVDLTGIGAIQFVIGTAVLFVAMLLVRAILETRRPELWWPAVAVMPVIAIVCERPWIWGPFFLALGIALAIGFVGARSPASDVPVVAGTVVGLAALSVLTESISVAGAIALILLVPAAWVVTAARRYVGADASAVLLTACVLVSGVTARLVDVDEAAKVVLSELEDEIERARRPVPAKDVAATDARWRASIARLPTSNGVWSSEGDRLRRWAAQSNVTITGTFSTRDYSARTYRKTDVTFCLAGEPDAIEGLMERVNARRRELGRVAHVTREPSAGGADIIFHLFASEPIEPEALAGDGVCDSFVWSLPFRSEVASVCREWQDARPVLEQIARHDAVVADLARREAILAEVADP